MSDIPGYIPAPLLYAHRIYNTLRDYAKPEMVALPMQDELQELLVFRGKLTDVFEDSGASKAYYSVIRKILVDSGSIVMLERGTAYAPTALAVDPSKPPPYVMPEGEGVPNVKSDELRELLLTVQRDAATLREQVRKATDRIGGMNIVEVLRNFESRISRLERERDTDFAGNAEVRGTTNQTNNNTNER